MKRIFTFISIATYALIGTSCIKEAISSEDLIENSDKVAEITIKTKGENSETIVKMFSDANIYRKSDYEGQSWFCAMSGGKMVYDAFMLSLYFECLDRLKAGDIIDPSGFWFTFYYSSNSDAWTHDYEGTITLAAKGDDFAILHFDNVLCSCLYGDYLIDGYLECPVYEEYGSN